MISMRVSPVPMVVRAATARNAGALGRADSESGANV